MKKGCRKLKESADKKLSANTIQIMNIRGLTSRGTEVFKQLQKDTKNRIRRHVRTFKTKLIQEKIEINAKMKGLKTYLYSSINTDPDPQQRVNKLET